MLDLKGRRYAVFGVANKNSICWAITQQLIDCGAEVILVVHPDLEEKVAKLAADNDKILAVTPCDVSSDDDIAKCFARLGNHAPLYGIVHGVAFSDKDELRGEFLATSRTNFQRTMDISCYSLIDIAARAREVMNDEGSILTLTFDAARGPYPHYNVMSVAKAALEAAMRNAAFDLGANNIRVNAISASPENTLSARGIGEFRLIGKFAESMSPMSRRATLEEIGAASAFLLSPVGSGITGQTVFVDCGSSVPTMPPARNASMMAEAMSGVASVHDNRVESGGDN